jgi:hypothetical protein
MIFDILENSKKTKSIIGLNTYGADNGFYCGFVLEYNEDFLIFQHFTKYGVYDGLLTLKLSDIKYIESNTIYLEGIKLLINNEKNVLEQTFHLNKKNDFNEDFTNLFESFIGNKDYIIKIELNDDDIFSGFIEWCDENYFTIINIDNDGLIIGKATFKFEDLKLYWVDDLDTRRKKMLYNLKNRSNK